MIEDAKHTDLTPLAGEVAKRIQITDIRLNGASIKLGRSHEDEQVLVRMEYQVKSERKHDSESGAKLLHVFVAPHLVVQPKSDDDASEDFLFRISAEFRLEYHLSSDEGLDEQHFDAFSRMNGVFNVWPYWREFVQSSVLRMGLPPLIVPVLTGGMLSNIYRHAADENG